MLNVPKALVLADQDLKPPEPFVLTLTNVWRTTMTFVLTAFAVTLTEELNVNVRGIGYLPKMEVAA